jgi:hypothetical protein
MRTACPPTSPGARLDLAGTRSFTAPGAGPARRAAIADFADRTGLISAGRGQPTARAAVTRAWRSRRSVPSAAATPGR